jgi:hypothetical protein
VLLLAMASTSCIHAELGALSGALWLHRWELAHAEGCRSILFDLSFNYMLLLGGHPGWRGRALRVPRLCRLWLPSRTDV